MPLAPIVAAVVVVPFVIATGLVGWYGVSLLEERTESRMREDIELVARAIRLPLSHALERGHDGTVERALESAFAIDRVYGVYVYDRDGATIYASGASAASMASDRAVRIAARGEQQGEFARAGDEEVFSYFVPLVDGGERINGLLQVTRRGSDFDSYIREVRWHTLAVIVVAGVALMLVVLAGHRWAVGRQFSAVEEGLIRIRGGALDHRLVPRGPRELRTLAGVINEMLDAMARSREALSEQKDAEAALKERLMHSEKLAALGQLAAGVAHELGSPLSTVDGKAQRALRVPELPPRVGDALHAIREQTVRMVRIVRQLLDFCRNNPLDLRNVPADYPLRSAVDMECAESGGHGLVEVQVAPEARKATLRIDAVRLEQALVNLLRNARQAGSTRVLASCRLGPDCVVYGFEDDGGGIPESARAHLFEPFFTTKPVGQGTGLGLAVAHASVRDHGGHIEVGMSVLGGAGFRVHIPFDTGSANDSEQQARQSDIGGRG